MSKTAIIIVVVVVAVVLFVALKKRNECPGTAEDTCECCEPDHQAHDFPTALGSPHYYSSWEKPG